MATNPLIIWAPSLLHQSEPDPCHFPEGGFPAKFWTRKKPQSHHTEPAGGCGWACRGTGWGGGRVESERNSCWVGELDEGGAQQKKKAGGRGWHFSLFSQWNKLLLCLQPVQTMLSLGWDPSKTPLTSPLSCAVLRYMQIQTKTPLLATLFAPKY